MKLTVVIPVYNEVETITEIVSHVQSVSIEKEIIIVDDFSSDGTREMLAHLEAQEDNLSVFYHEENYGKGRALRTGFAEAQGDYVIIQDADLEYDPRDYHKLLEPLEQGKADVVFGSRFTTTQAHRVLYYWHSLGNKLLTTLSNITTDLNLTDMETCYKVFHRTLIQSLPLEEDRFGFEPEVTAKLARSGARIYEVGIAYHGRTYAEGKKIGILDAFWAVWCIFKYWLKPLRLNPPS